MIVVDASVVVDFLLGAGSPASDRLAELLREGMPLAAPALLDVEVTQALRRFVLAGVLEPRLAAVLVDELTDLPIDRFPHEPLVARAFDLRDRLTAYDGVYVALAEQLDAGLLTGDVALRGSGTARVEVVATTR